jgi:hypothetical protein
MLLFSIFLLELETLFEIDPLCTERLIDESNIKFVLEEVLETKFEGCFCFKYIFWEGLGGDFTIRGGGASALVG